MSGADCIRGSNRRPTFEDDSTGATVGPERPQTTTTVHPEHVALMAAEHTAALAGAELASEMVGGVGWAISLYQMGEAVLNATGDGMTDQLLRRAFVRTHPAPTSAAGESRARDEARAIGLVLAGASDAQIRRAEAQAGNPAVFRAALTQARSLRDSDIGSQRVGFQHAAEQYRSLRQDWESGVAAALEGWPTSAIRDRSDAFMTGYTRTQLAVQMREPWVPGARRTALESRREGFTAVTREVLARPPGPYQALERTDHSVIDWERVERDASYRSGFRWAEHIYRARGREGLERELHRVERERTPARGSTAAPLSG